MKATPHTPTSKTTVRYLVQFLAQGQWHTQAIDRNQPGNFKSLAGAKAQFTRQEPHFAPGTLRVVRSEIVSTWTEVEV